MLRYPTWQSFGYYSESNYAPERDENLKRWKVAILQITDEAWQELPMIASYSLFPIKQQYDVLKDWRFPISKFSPLITVMLQVKWSAFDNCIGTVRIVQVMKKEINPVENNLYSKLIDSHDLLPLRQKNSVRYR